MKLFQKTLLAIAATTVMATGANAALAYNDNSMTTHHVLGYAGQPYVGLKVGQFDTDINSSDYSNDKPTAYGIYGGYQFDPNWGVEAEYMGSDKADVTAANAKVGTIKNQTYGLYGTYKYDFPSTAIYAKGKLGVAQTKLTDEGTDSEGEFKVDSSKTNVAGGLGLGYNISPTFAVEAEYEFLPKVNDVKSDAWTVGAHMKF